MAGVLETLTKAGLTPEQIRKLGAAKDAGTLPGGKNYVPLSQAPAPVAPKTTYPPRNYKPPTAISPYGKPLTGRYTPQQTEQFRQDPMNQSIIQQLQQAAQTRYGQYNDEQVLGLANKVQNEGYPIEVVMEMLRSGYGVKDPNLRYVGDVVGMEYDPQESALKRAQDEARRQYELGVNTQNLYRERARGDLQSIYDALARELGQGQEATEGIFDTARGQVGQAYSGAADQTQTAMQQVLAQIASDAERMNLGAALPEAQGDIASDLAFYLQQMQGAGASGQANLATLGAQELGIGQRGIDSSRRELAQGQSNIVNQVLGAIGQLGLGYQAENRDIMGQLSDLAGSRGAALRAGTTEREETMADRAAQAAQAQLEAELGRGTLGIQEGELDLQRQEMIGSLQMQEAELSQRALEARMNNSIDAQSLEIQRQKVQAEIDKIYSDIMADQSSVGQGGTLTSGFPALESFFNQERPEWEGGSPGAGPIFRRSVQEIITRAMAEANPVATGGTKVDPWQLAHTFAGNYPTQNQELLRQAIDIFFGKTGPKGF